MKYYSSSVYFREYAVFSGMKARCFNPKATGYHNYGGRGITVCEEWLGPGGFQKFMDHVGPRPSSEHSIDRYPNNNGNYEPGNVRWATKLEQSSNTRRTKRFIFKGIKTSRECADILGISIPLLYYRVKKGRILQLNPRNGRPVVNQKFTLKANPIYDPVTLEEVKERTRDIKRMTQAKKVFARMCTNKKKIQ